MYAFIKKLQLPVLQSTAILKHNFIQQLCGKTVFYTFEVDMSCHHQHKSQYVLANYFADSDLLLFATCSTPVWENQLTLVFFTNFMCETKTQFWALELHGQLQMRSVTRQGLLIWPGICQISIPPNKNFNPALNKQCHSIKQTVSKFLHTGLGFKDRPQIQYTK